MASPFSEVMLFRKADYPILEVGEPSISAHTTRGDSGGGGEVEYMILHDGHRFGCENGEGGKEREREVRPRLFYREGLPSRVQ